jgi:lysozyme
MKQAEGEVLDQKKESASERFKNIALGLAGLISSIAIPLVGFYFTDQQNRRSQETEQAQKSRENLARQSEQDKEIAEKFVELGIKILSEKPLSLNDPVRSWAIAVVNRYSNVPLNEETQEALESGSFFVPGQISQKSLQELDEKGYSKGIDVSHFNGKVDFKSIAQDGFSFVYVKATEGINFKDSSFQNFVSEAQAADLHVGLYHFFKPIGGSQQVDNFVHVLSSAKSDLPPVVDFEPLPNISTPDNYADIAYDFMTQLAKAVGRPPIVYTFRQFADAHLDARFSQFPLFLADLSNRARMSAPQLPKWWQKLTLWQVAAGITDNEAMKNIDVIVYKGSVAELLKLAVQ